MIFRFWAQVLYTILVLIETIISVRFVFRLIDANADNTIVAWVYQVSDAFVWPFQGIVTADVEIAGFFIDVDAIVALVMYMFIAFVIAEIIKIFAPPAR
ncbi:MAG: YggT family protein [Candidatus Dojkabacteria bacterium]|nr:YggT family protein [Candidatus Dojkabacteria bacterium]